MLEPPPAPGFQVWQTDPSPSRSISQRRQDESVKEARREASRRAPRHSTSPQAADPSPSRLPGLLSIRQPYVIPEISVILLKRFDSVTFWFPIHSLSFNICKRFFFYFYFGVHVFRHCIFLSKLFLQIVPDNQLQVFARSSMIGNMISEPTSSSGVFLPC